MKKTVVLFLVLNALVASVLGDCYLHFPRGSNDRLNEENENRNNGNRLCDTQNNAKGGYCINADGRYTSYYEGSLLMVEWTAQHACGNKIDCTFILQYMCGNRDDPAITNIRDGTTTDTISDATVAEVDPATGQFKFGQHETSLYYNDCETRKRNRGLWTSDRNLNGDTARFTRQNENGNRNGFECPEERDYYPYWHPTPWKDIAVFTHDTSRCNFYQQESQNVKAKNLCVDPAAPNVSQPFNNEAECNQNGKKWQKFDPFQIAPPVCLAAPWSRDNHLGNGFGGEPIGFNWTIPFGEKCAQKDNCNCVFRIRYNMTSNDNGLVNFGFNTTDGRFNKQASPVKNDPEVLVTGNNLTLAFDTSQYARTFQDRSHVFGIKVRPPGFSPLTRIYNVGIKGKRGNIVQTYPATEYDFIPTFLDIRLGDFIHFQWQGCDHNPANAAGEGTAKTDRSNIVQITDIFKNFPLSDAFLDANSGSAMFDTFALRQRFAFLDQKLSDCPSLATLLANNNNNKDTANADPSNCFKLNAASAIQDFGLIRFNKTGNFAYMSTRNNNFSNRGQKAQLNVNTVLPVWGTVVVVCGAFVFVGALGVGGATFYAKANPTSKVAEMLGKF